MTPIHFRNRPGNNNLVEDKIQYSCTPLLKNLQCRQFLKKEKILTASIITELITIFFTIRVGKDNIHGYSKWTAAINVIQVTAVWHSHTGMQMSMYWVFLHCTVVLSWSRCRNQFWHTNQLLQSPLKTMKDILWQPRGLTFTVKHRCLHMTSLTVASSQHPWMCNTFYVARKIMEQRVPSSGVQ